MDTTLDSNTIDDNALQLLTSIFGPIDTLELPIDLNRVAENCGLTIRQGTFIEKDIEGALDRKTLTVFLSENDTFEKKNFTLAHEIGHFKLHDEIETDVFTMRQLQNLLERQGKELTEDQADQFAAALLMPKKLTTDLWKASSQSVKALAKIFGVPETVVQFRLRTLKLI